MLSFNYFFLFCIMMESCNSMKDIFKCKRGIPINQYRIQMLLICIKKTVGLRKTPIF